jgi:hypothetical protein
MPGHNSFGRSFLASQPTRSGETGSDLPLQMLGFAATRLDKVRSSTYVGGRMAQQE